MQFMLTPASISEIELASKISLWQGIGLIKAELAILDYSDEHPLHLVKTNPRQLLSLYVNMLIAASSKVYPAPVRFRFSDLRTHECRDLKYGKQYEQYEDNPMLGWRGIIRLTSKEFLCLYKLEYEAICIARSQGLTNIEICLPFVRSSRELSVALEILNINSHGKNDLKLRIWTMAEIPSNFFESSFLDNNLIYGYIIGTSDLYQLIFARDRENPKVNTLHNDEVITLANIINDFSKRAFLKGKKIAVGGYLLDESPELRSILAIDQTESFTLGYSTLEKLSKLTD